MKDESSVLIRFPAKLCLWLASLTIVTCILGGAATASEPDKHDPCSFLTVAEVQAILGPLAGPPYRAGGDGVGRVKGQDCRYEAPDRRFIKLNVSWSGGDTLISMMGAIQGAVDKTGLSRLKLLDGTTIDGHWEQARVNSCCEFNALSHDRIVAVDISGSRATIEQAASLADAAIQRLDTPLAISGEAGVAAAQQRAALRPKPRNVCDLLTAANAEAIVGVALLQPPKGTNDKCHYAWPNKNLGDYELDLAVTWRDGFSEMRTTDSAVGNASSMMGMAMTKPAGSGAETGPWDEFSSSIIGVSAVKGDVRVSIEGGPMQQDIQRAFVKQAIINLGQ